MINTFLCHTTKIQMYDVVFPGCVCIFFSSYYSLVVIYFLFLLKLGRVSVKHSLEKEISAISNSQISQNETLSLLEQFTKPSDSSTNGSMTPAAGHKFFSFHRRSLLSINRNESRNV